MHKKTQSRFTIRNSCIKRSTIRMTGSDQQRLSVLSTVRQIWQTVKEMKSEISHAAILKFLHKFMERKGFHFQQLILQLLRTHSLTKKQIFTAEHPIESLLQEMGCLKEELEQFLLRRFSRDIEIMEQKIVHADQQIRDSLDQQQYEHLIYSFRPLLISNPSDLMREYQNIPYTTAQKNFSRLQQTRYQRLALSSRRISDLHNFVCEQKSGVKVLHGHD